MTFPQASRDHIRHTRDLVILREVAVALLDALEAAEDKIDGQAWEDLQKRAETAEAKLADAWDEGYRNGYSIGYRDDPNALTNYRNPYRPAVDDEDDAP